MFKCLSQDDIKSSDLKRMPNMLPRPGEVQIVQILISLIC